MTSAAPSRVLETFSELGIDLDPQLFRLAMAHRSWAYENGGLPTNERLEFLGDAVLGLVVTDELYRSQPDLPEGYSEVSDDDLHALGIDPAIFEDAGSGLQSALYRTADGGYVLAFRGSDSELSDWLVASM